jgi:glycosyltransferase involved in cell wall biosynthesis
MVNKKFLIICSYPDSILSFRGPLIHQFLNNGYQVHIGCPNLVSNKIISQPLKDLNIILHDVPLSRASLNPFGDLKTFVSIFLLLKNIKPDIAFFYTVKPVIYGLFASYLADIKNVFPMITGLGYAFQERAHLNIRQIFAALIVKKLYWASLRFARKIFFQNIDDYHLFISEKLISQNKEFFVTNGSGVNITFFGYSEQYAPDTFLCIARLLRAKGIYEYAEAAKITKRKFPNATFLLAGWIDSNPDSINETDLKVWSKEKHINFLGKLNTQEDVRNLIENSSVYVLPSYREGTPRTVLEAMSIGRPIITTDVPGCRQTIIDCENGFLVPPKDVISLTKAFEVFLTKPELIKKMGLRSRELAEQKYDSINVNSAIFNQMHS